MLPSQATEQNGVIFETAGDHVATLVPTASVGDLVSEVRRNLEGRRFETLAAVAVTDDGRLQGVVPLAELMAAPADSLVRDVMDASPAVVGPGVDQEVAAWHAVQHDEAVLAVVDERHRFIGLVPPERMLAVLLWEHEEDMARLGGFMHAAASAQQASREPVIARLWHRLPWLIVGLAGALAAAFIVASFEGRLQSNVALAFFIPGIVYMADAVGTQTETLVIRGLSVGVRIGDVVKREIVTGLLVGLAIAATFLPIALWQWDYDVALAAALALLAACSMATLVAMVLPWLLNKAGKDPAFGSGPLATVVQDLFSIVIYFGIVVLVVD
ncbi:MAG TPA: magnesium transporter [Jiangellaceae bacterium]